MFLESLNKSEISESVEANLKEGALTKYLYSGILAAILTVVLAACGGGAGDSASNANTDAIKLSGLVTTGDVSAAQDAPDDASRRGSSPYSQIAVLAIDEKGNSFATTTDSSGFFEFQKETGLRANTGYAIIFVDMAKLEIIATLTNGSGEAGLLTLPGDSEISEIIIEPEIRLAAIIGVINSGAEPVNLKLAAADSLDADSDGQISQAEIINALVKTTQQGEIDTITSVSVFTFLGVPNTWTIAVDLEDDAFTASVCDWIDEDDLSITPPAECNDVDDDNDPEVDFLTDSAEMTLLVTSRVEGPGESIVDAVKLLEFTFLNKPFVDPDSEFADIIDTDLLWDTGFASGNQADINDQATQFGSGPGTADEYWTPYLDAQLGNPPTSDYNPRMGLLGWSQYSFADSDLGRLINGTKSKNPEDGRFEFEWGESSLPLNFPINMPFEFTETETDEEIDPDSGDAIIVETVVTSTVTVQLVVVDGTPALLQEGGGSTTVLPVFQIRFETVEDEEDEVECSYIIARFGVEGDDADEDCDDMSDWLESFVDVRFGRVVGIGDSTTVVDSTPASIVANDSGEDGLPVNGDGSLTVATRDWLKYMSAQATVFDYQFDAVQLEDEGDFGSFAEFWAWVEQPVVGSALAPQPFTSQNGSSLTLLKMGEAPGLITVKELHYHSKDSGVQFFLDIRNTDPESLKDESVLDEPVTIEAGVDTSEATAGETVIDISASIPELPASGSTLWLNIWPSVENPGSGEQLFDTTRVTVWVIMDADGDLDTEDDQYQFPVDSYKVIDAG